MSSDQPNIPAVVSIQHVVRNYMVECAYGMKEYKRLVQMAIRGFSNLNMTELRSVSTFYARADQNGQIFLPPDYVDYCAIGYRMGNKVYVLSRNKSLYVKKDGPNGQIEQFPDEDGVEVLYVFSDHYYRDSVISHLFGYKGEFTGQYFNIDTDNKILQLSSMVPRVELIIEYSSTGVSLNGNTYVPRFAEQALIEWLYWRDAKGRARGNVTRGVIADSKQDFVEELNVIRDIQTLCTLEEALDAIYSSAGQTPKR